MWHGCQAVGLWSYPCQYQGCYLPQAKSRQQGGAPPVCSTTTTARSCHSQLPTLPAGLTCSQRLSRLTSTHGSLAGFAVRAIFFCGAPGGNVTALQSSTACWLRWQRWQQAIRIHREFGLAPHGAEA